jgi:hypothetical protein
MSPLNIFPEGRVDLEQPPVKQSRRIVGDRLDGCKAFLDEGFLPFSQHVRSPSV